jgi:hypothetical protein
MRKWSWLLSAALAASAISCVATVPADEENESDRHVSIREIPAPARDAILRHVGSGRLMDVVETSLRGQTVYQGRIRDGAHTATIWVDAAGNIVNTRRSM